MPTSNFKESYTFLKDYFILMTARPRNLKYSPHTKLFYEEYYEYFDVYFVITEQGEYEFSIVIPRTNEIEKAVFSTEREMLENFREKMKSRKKIGQLKKMFPV